MHAKGSGYREAGALRLPPAGEDCRETTTTTTSTSSTTTSTSSSSTSSSMYRDGYARGIEEDAAKVVTTAQAECPSARAGCFHFTNAA